MVGRDRLVQTRLKLASCCVAHIFSVIGDVDDTVAAHLRWTDSTTPDLAVVCLALELPTRSICRLVVVSKSNHALPELRLLRQSPHRTACTRDRAGW